MLPTKTESASRPASASTLIEQYPLQPQKIIKKTAQTLLVIVPALLVCALGTLAVGQGGWWSIGALMLLALVSVGVYYYETLYYRNYFYDLTPEGLVIGKGVIGRWKVTLPRHKVQEVYIDQDLLDRIFGLYDLHLSTATDISARESHMDGLGGAQAQELRTLLVRWIGEGRTTAEEGVAAGDARATGARMTGDRTNEARMMGDRATQGRTAAAAGAAATTAVIAPEALGADPSGQVPYMIWNLLLGALGLLFLFPPLVLLAPAFAVVAYLDYKALRYELRPEGIFIRSGFFIPKESIYLYRNIQDVEDSQGILDRLIGLHTLSVKTMTGASAAGSKLAYLRKDDAQRWRDRVLQSSRMAADGPGRLAYASQSTTTASATEQKTTLRQSGTARETSRLGGTPLPAQAMPFRNHFMQEAKYTSATVAVIWVLLGLLVVGMANLLVPALGWMGVLFFLGLGLLHGAAVLVFAWISMVSYYYELDPQVVRIRQRFITLSEKQIPYGKIQDVERDVSLVQSFIGLATLKLETGSKEYMSRGNPAVSASMANERIPALESADAQALKERITQRMGIGLKGLGNDPLVGIVPLDSRKPLKKTVSWILLFAGAIAVLKIIFIGLGMGLTNTASLFSLALLWDKVLFTIMVIGFIVTGIKYLYEREYYKRYYYDMNKDVLLIRKGVFGSRELTVPLERIQDVFVDRDILDRVFGLYDVYVSTATERSILNAHIDGLNAEHAEAVALMLVEAIAEKK